MTMTLSLWEIQGFKSKEDYLESIAKGKGFESLAKYEDYITRKNLEEKETKPPTWARQGFGSFYEYQKHQVEEKGFESLHKYREHLDKEKGREPFSKRIKHMTQERIAHRKGFSSHAEYEEDIAKLLTTITEIPGKRQKLCDSIQEIIFDVKDPESLFNDKEFINKITALNNKLSCNIPTKGIKL